MRIALVTGKWCELDINFGETSGNYNLLGSLNSAGYSPDTFYYDEYFHHNGINIDERLLASCRTNRPDVMVVNHHPVPTPRNVGNETYRQIREMGIPIIFFWFDFVHDEIKGRVFELLPYATLNVVIDVPYDHEKFLPMWVPQDHNIFFGDKTYKDIEVGFIGTRYADRHHYLNHLLRHGIPVTISGGQRDHRLSINEYANLLRRSKISINFSVKPPGLYQAKCRIYESMLCGALLLEQDNHCIKKWFEPMVHYVPFGSEMDLLEKINYYLHHHQEREDIALRGQAKMIKDYHSAIWWRTVFAKI